MIKNILNKLINDNIDIKVDVNESNRPELCDYQISNSFKLAKELHKSPMDIANDIKTKIEEIDNINYYIKDISIVNGFINFILSDEFINDNIRSMNHDNKYNIDTTNNKIVIDYGGPNVAKPLHVGHLRTAIIGEAIKRILEYKGDDVIADVHLGDYGLQIGQVIYAIKKDNIKDEDITLEYLNEAYPRMSSICKEDEDIKKECEEITKAMQEGDPEYNRLCDIIWDISANDIKDIYKYLDVSFDLWYGERYEYQFIEALNDIFEKKNLLEVSNGATVVDVKEEDDKKELPPLIYRKSNGAYLYATTDLATIYQREKDYQPDNIIYVTDARQGMHFTQVFRAAKKAELTNALFEHKGYGTVNGLDGKPFKTRAGKAPSLRELLNETKDIFVSKKEDNKNMSDEDLRKIVNSIIKFADLQNNLVNDYIFDINKFSNTSGKTGPYLQYTVLRLKKVVDTEGFKDELSNTIYNDVDRRLRLKLINVGTYIDKAYESRIPSYLVDYIYDLANEANNFYQNNHIISLNDETNKTDWIYILNKTVEVLTDMLYLIGIDIPTYM